MNPIQFPESNLTVAPPKDLAESQCGSIDAYVGRVGGGSVDGAALVVTAWRPAPEELEVLNQGGPIYVSFLGGLPPHFLTVSFEAATHPA